MQTELLRTLATNFDANRLFAAGEIRKLYKLDPVVFFPIASELVRTEPQLPGIRFLISILAADPEWLRGVCTPSRYSTAQSLHLIQLARKADPLIELRLARILASLPLHSDAEIRFASRVLEVLERSPYQSATIPALRQLVQSANGHVRSKAALLIGRINRNPQWANQGLLEPDQRVSANAVESLWGVATPAAREAFWNAAHDTRHRIAANGIVGLYQMGDFRSVALLFQLSEMEAALSRAAAAWAMGTLGDPRYQPRLSRLMQDPDPTVKKAAFRSIAHLRQRITAFRAAGTMRIQITDAHCRGGVHVIRAVVQKDDLPVTDLDARHFVIWSGPDMVEEFSLAVHEGTTPHYELEYKAAPSSTQMVKVQIYADQGVGEESGFEMSFG